MSTVGRRGSRGAYVIRYPAAKPGWILIIAIIVDDPFHQRLQIAIRYLELTDFASVAENTHMREAQSAECGIGGHVERVDPRIEQKVIMIGAGQYSERCSV